LFDGFGAGFFFRVGDAIVCIGSKSQYEPKANNEDFFHALIV